MDNKTERLLSIDALRGFDMFFIIGGAAIISSLCAAFGCADGWIASQMKHVKWAGLAHHDTIFPLFFSSPECRGRFRLLHRRLKAFRLGGSA
jgi:predicted acyltransferase